MKLKITFLIVCALFLGTVTGWGQAIIGSGTITGSTLTWTLTSDGTLTVSAPSGADAMPDFNSGSSPWFNLRANISSIVIEDGVTKIGRFAFENCNRLTSVDFTASVKAIGLHAFRDCSLLSLINLQEVETIDDRAFHNCNSLTSITIPATVTSIGEGVFAGCRQLATVTVAAGNGSYIADNDILYNLTQTSLLFYPYTKTDATFNVPATVETIETAAFTENPNITAVNIPPSVKYIRTDAFNNCISLSSVTLSEGLIQIGSYAFEYCAFPSITLPASLYSIDIYAFAFNTALTSISIPANVYYIGGGIVANCPKLQTIDVDGANTAYVADDNVIYIADRTRLVMYPVGNTDTSFDVPAGVITIGEGAFAGDTTLLSVTLPASVTDIQRSAFSDCSRLASIDLTNVTTLGIASFRYSGLTSIVIPAGITDIPIYAFSSCQKLDSVTIEEGVTAIGEWAFGLCPALTSVSIPNSVTTINNSAFMDCHALELINIPGSVSYIRLQAFAHCASLKDVIVHWQNAIAPAISSFDYIHPEAVLHIPKGTLASYEADPVWSSKFTIKELETLTVEENEPAVTGNEGSIALSLSIPANSTIVGTFKVILPIGMRLDESRTQLVDELLTDYELIIEEVDGENAWQFTIRERVAGPAGLAARLRTVSQITKILDIGFAVEDDVANGDYEVKLTDLDLKLKDLTTGSETDIDDVTELTVTIPVTRTVAVTAIAITPGSLSGETGGSAQLTATVTPDNATDATVTWSSNNDAVATVSTSGLVNYVSAGTATITATANDGSGKSASITVTVTDPVIPVDPDPIVVAVTSITINPGSLTGLAGATAQLTVAVAPDNATDATVTWTSSNTAVATVNAEGLVTYVANGTATITATANDGSGVSASITVTVTPSMATDAANAVALVIRPLGGALQISGLVVGEELSVYAASGQLIYKGKAAASEVYLPLGARGALIVVAGKRTVKTVLN